MLNDSCELFNFIPHGMAIKEILLLSPIMCGKNDTFQG